MLFGSNRDFNLLVNINRELIKDIVEQEVLYYKLDLYGTESNIYGESLEKVWNSAVKLNCLITRGDQIISIDEFGPDLSREMSFAFLKDDLIDIKASLTTELETAKQTMDGAVKKTAQMEETALKKVR